jgi:hypothetical protein
VRSKATINRIVDNVV